MIKKNKFEVVERDGEKFKTCSKCGIEKNIDEFHNDRTNDDGKDRRCKLCKKEYDRQKNIKNKDKIKQWREENKEILHERGKIQYQKSKEKVKIKRDNRRKSPVKYDVFYEKLKLYDEIREGQDGNLEVKCTYCGQYFEPTALMVDHRIRVINHSTHGDGRMYCSNGCKNACPIYRRIKYPRGFSPSTSREVQPELRKMVLERDNYQCQKCGKTIQETELHCHHIDPVKGNEITSADIDVCITLCKNCHREAHSTKGCRYIDLANCEIDNKE